MKLNLANNCAPKFRQRTIYWITNREGAVLFKDGKFHTEMVRQSNLTGDLRELQEQPVRMHHQPEAWTTTDVKSARERLARMKWLNMGGIESCKMLVQIQSKGGGKAFHSRNATYFPSANKYYQREMQGHANYLIDMVIEQESPDFRAYNHQQRMQRQQAHKHAN